MNREIRRAIAGIEVGTPVTPAMGAAVGAVYAPYHEAEPYAGVTVRRGLAYGPDERHRLDLFLPAAPAANAPLVLFVPGGGFVGGARRTPGTPYYDNVGVWAARAGYLGATMDYRLAPTHRFPAGAEDVGRALAFLASGAGLDGPDRPRFLLGQSAGASHVGGYVALRAEGGLDGPPLDGAVLMSGIYDYEAAGPIGPVNAYVGDNPADLRRAGAVAGLAAARIPLLICVAEYDTPLFHRQSWSLAAALFVASGTTRFPNVVSLAGHNHLSQIRHLNARGTGDEILSAHLRDFFAAHSEKAAVVR